MVDAEIARPDSNSADAVVDLWLDLAEGQRQYGSHIDGDANRTQIRESVLRHLAGDRLLVARAPTVCGFVMFTLEHGEFEQDVTRGIIENLYVAPDARNEGVGSALVEAAETRLAESGADVTTLRVMAENEAARRFYRRHGYEPHRIEMEK